MSRLIDRTGQVFGWLLVLDRALRFQKRHRRRHTHWRCRCTCGRITIVDAANLVTGTTKSCGCQRVAATSSAKRTHGYSRTPTYRVWEAMLSRCSNPRQYRYRDYGAKGITVCARWRDSFEAFLEDMGERPDGLTLDRKDNDRGYEPGNCRWADKYEQARNRRNSITEAIATEVIGRREHGEPVLSIMTRMKISLASITRISSGEVFPHLFLLQPRKVGRKHLDVEA